MSSHVSTYAEPDADFDAIEQAVMETERGRTFLKEYAKRNRHADTQVLLTSLSRIEKGIALRQSSSAMDEFRTDIIEMADVIARSREEIASLQPDVSGASPFIEASDHLETIVLQTEATTSSILAAAESIQELAWTMRETGVDQEQCATLDELATVIYTSCSSQDVTIQRTRKIIGTINFLESRLSALAEICGIDHKTTTESDEERATTMMTQEDIDFVLVDEKEPDIMRTPAPEPVAPFLPEIAPKTETAHESALVFESASIDDDMLFDTNVALEQAPVPVAPASLMLVAEQAAAAPLYQAEDSVFDAPAMHDMIEPIQKAKAGVTLNADEAARALDALKSMSVEQRSHLFS